MSNSLDKQELTAVMEQHASYWMPLKMRQQRLHPVDMQELQHRMQQEAIEAAGIVVDDPWSSF